MRRSHWIVPFLFLVGCAHKPDVKTETPPATEQKAPETKPEGADANAARQCTQDADCKDSEVCNQSVCVAASSAMLGDCGLVRVHFPFDSTEIIKSDRTELERSARCLRAHQHVTVTIEGNADERGTEEYNLALGDRRATAVAKYLRSLGASDAQLKTISYGKERPLCTEHDEACWAKNRRAAVRPPIASNEQ